MRPHSAGAATRSYRAISALVLGSILFAATGCTSSVNGTGQVDVMAADAYRSEQSSVAARSRQDATGDADYAFCATVAASTVSMLRTYNVFIAALNSKQAYADLGGADRRAIAEFARGSGAISQAMTGEVSASIRGQAQQLLDRTAGLSKEVGTGQLGPLNAASAAWIRARDVVLDSCGPFASPSASASPSVPSSPSGSPGG